MIIIFCTSLNWNFWRYWVLQVGKTKTCECTKYYKKLKQIAYLKCLTYLLHFKKLQFA
jgi:hypothetical protein